jgi:ferritin
MLSEKMQDAMNRQFVAETFSAYLYWSMAAYFESVNLAGFSQWMKSQAQEELLHASKFFGFINERGGRVKMGAIEAPPTEWESPLAVFESALAHERKVTGLINDLVDIALDERDHASNSFLNWFVDEQVEEESSADAVVQKLKLMGEAPGGLFMLDQELGQRVFVMPATTEGGA